MQTVLFLHIFYRFQPIIILFTQFFPKVHYLIASLYLEISYTPLYAHIFDYVRNLYAPFIYRESHRLENKHFHIKKTGLRTRQTRLASFELRRVPGHPLA